MDPDPRAWEPFDPDAPQQSPRLAEASVVAVVPSPALRESEWAPEAAVALARGWAETHGRILLADLDLERPRLTAALDLEPREGVSDAFLFGASLGRIAQPVGPGLLAVPAGTAVADVEAVLASPRWETLVDGFTEAGAILALYVPADIAGRDAVLARADAVVVLALAGEAEGLDLGEAAARVEGVLGPREEDGTGAGTRATEEPHAPHAPHAKEPEAGEPGAEPPEAAEPEDVPVPPEVPASEAEEVPAAAPPEDSYVGAAPEPAQHPPEEPGEIDRAGEPVQTGGRSRTGVLVLALLVVVVAVVVAALYGLVQIPGLTPGDADASQARTGSAVAPAPASASPGDAGVGGEGSAVAGSPLPTEPVQGWSLTLGAFEEGAVARQDPSRWIVRETPLAFRVGVLPDADEAAPLRAVFHEQGIDAELAPRVGRALRSPSS